MLKKSYVTVTGKASRQRDLIDNPKIVRPLYFILILLTSFIVIMYVLIPISSFVKVFGQDNTFTLMHYKEIFRFKNRMLPIITTTQLSLIATFISSFLSMIIAFNCKKRFLFKGFIELCVMMRLAIPGTIIGMVML